MKKNNKGFFLAETIVMIALVTTVMAFVYPNVAKLYENFKNRTTYYDQTEDLYVLKAFYEYYYDYYESENPEVIGNAFVDNELGCKIYSNNEIIPFVGKTGGFTINDEKEYLKAMFITGYMTEISSSSLITKYGEYCTENCADFNEYNLNKYLKRLKRTTYDTASYRVIGIFIGKDGNERYASIKIDNPNPLRNCNLGG